jgi:ATP-dependent 26S proteasome regulatory subunit
MVAAAAGDGEGIFRARRPRTFRRAAVSSKKDHSPTEPAPCSEGAAMPRRAEGPSKVSELCLDRRKPPEVRAKILLDVLNNHDEPTAQQAVLADLLRQSASGPEAEVAQLRERYEQALAELEQGAVRPATYLGPADGTVPAPQPRAHVVTPDGQERFPTLHPRVRLAELQTGMTVFLDPRGSVVLGASPDPPRVGQEGTFLRLVEGTRLIEAAFQNDRLVLYAAAPVLEAVAAGRVKNGDRLLVCPRRHLALAVVPPETDHRHRFVDRGRVPDVVAERDIGKPHEVLDYLVRRLRIFLFRPDLLTRFDLRPRLSVLLTGPSGCGKTLTICAFLRELDRMLVERTGRHDLGSRVVRVKVAELLSEWLGKTDKNIEELFDDIHAVAAAEVVTAGGEKLRLPVVVILEEVEGLARRRGAGGDAGVYDRILGTLLQRLDAPTEGLDRLPLVVLSTTNRPDLIDAAMIRRLGTQARFRRLDREGLAAVLDKKLKPHYAYAPGERREALNEQVVRWLFGPGGPAQALLEVELADGRTLVKRRRDFLTGAVVEQAVAGAIDQVVGEAERTGSPEAGLTAAAVIEALRRQIDALADNLSQANAADYLDLPENAQVAALRRVSGPAGPLPSLLSELDN